MNYSKLDVLLKQLTNEQIIPAISVSIRKKNEILFSNCYGSIYETQSKITDQSRFDIASMTKIITGICFMQLIEEGLIGLSDFISEIFPELNTKKEIEKNGKVVGWCNAGEITWFQALTHTTGMGWARPKTRPSLPNLDEDLQDIFTLPFAYMPGEHVVYSDLPFMLMGKAIERVTGKLLDTVVEEKVCNPMKLQHTGYLRISRNRVRKENIIPTENDTVFRKRRIWGEVHDESAYLLDGVAGHAGIFSTSEDICRLLMEYALCRRTDGILKKDTIENMIVEHAKEDGDRRGLIWQLSGSGEKEYTKFLSPNAYGHAGFTGCFGWNDPEKDLTIVLLSNDVYNGRENRKLFDYRQQIMKVILDV